jgi:hypothetical protein
MLALVTTTMLAEPLPVPKPPATNAPTKRARLPMISPKPSFDGWFFGFSRN